MKKKLWTGILAAALILSISTVTALAREPHCPAWPGRHNADGICAYYTDEDGDGQCDHFNSGAYGYGHHARWQRSLNQNEWSTVPNGLWHLTEDGSWARCIDADGSGVCDTRGAAIPLRDRFKDADNDGICDYFGSASCGGGHCGGHGGCWR